MSTEIKIEDYGHPGTHPPEIINETDGKQFVSQAEKDNWDAGGGAGEADASAAAALVSEQNSAQHEANTVVNKNATAADLVQTNQDTIDTAADLVETNQDVIDTAASAAAALVSENAAAASSQASSDFADQSLINSDKLVASYVVPAGSPDSSMTIAGLDLATDVEYRIVVSGGLTPSGSPGNLAMFIPPDQSDASHYTTAVRVSSAGGVSGSASAVKELIPAMNIDDELYLEINLKLINNYAIANFKYSHGVSSLDHGNGSWKYIASTMVNIASVTFISSQTIFAAGCRIDVYRV